MDSVRETSTEKIQRRQHWVALAVLAVLVLISYPTWQATGWYTYDDLARLNAPQRILLAWFYLHGHWPLWNPFSFAGQPFLAAGQAGPLYVPNVVFVVLPIGVAFKVSYLFHELLAAFGMYAAAFHLWRKSSAALVSAVAFTTCGFLVGHQIHTQMFDAMCWLPLCFWLCLRILEAPTLGRATCFAAALAMEIFAGHPQVSFYICLTLALYTLVCLLRRPSRRWWARVAGVFGGMVFALGLSATQWLPTLDLVSYSSRDNASAYFLLGNSMPWNGLFQFLTPFSAGGGLGSPALTQNSFMQIYGSPLFWEFTCYVGSVTLLLALAAIGTQVIKSARVLALTVLVFFAIMLAVGENGIFSFILVDVPGFDLFRVPARYVGLADFSLALLAGCGFALLRERAERSRSLMPIIAASALCIMVVLFVIKATIPLPNWSWSTVVIQEVLLGVVLLLQLPRWVPSTMRTWGVWALLMVDCVGQGGLLSQFPVTPWSASYVQPSGPVQYLRAHLDASAPFERVADFGAGDLAQDRSVAWQIPAVNGYDSLVPDWYDRYVRLTWNENVLTGRARSLLDALDVGYVLTPADWHPSMPTWTSGISQWEKWITLPRGTDGLTIHLSTVPLTPISAGPLVAVTLTSGQNHVTQVLDGFADADYYIPLPEHWPTGADTKVSIRNELWNGAVRVDSIQLTGNSLPTFSRKTAVNRVFAPQPWMKVYTDGRTTVWQNPDRLHPAWVTPNKATPLDKDLSTVALAHWTPNRQTWQVSNTDGGELMVSQMFDPNWHATVDGRNVPVEQISLDGAKVLTGIPVPKGNHKVVLTYMPSSFQLGLSITLLSSLVAVALAVRALRRRKATQ